MATTIKLKNGSGAPLAGDLVQGEPALDLTNKRLYTEDSGGTVIEVGTNPTSLTTGTFTSTGIDDNATSTAITIDSNENVGIGATSPAASLDVNVTAETPNASTFKGAIIGQNSGTMSLGTAVGLGFVLRNTAGGSLGGNSLGGAIYGVQVTSGVNEGALTFHTRPNHLSFPERMRIDSSGNVGIGTTSPSTKLHLSGGDPSIRLTPSSTNDARIDFTDNTGTVRWYTGFDESSGNYVVAADESGFASSNIVVVDDNGNVGIGTTSPWSDAQLTVDNGGSGNSSIALSRSASGQNDVALVNDAGQFKLKSGSASTVAGLTDQMRISDVGNVYLGTDNDWFTSSGRKILRVHGAGGGSFLVLDTSGSGDFYIGSENNGVVNFWNQANADLIFATNNTERMRILPSGNIGMGLSSDYYSAKLAVGQSGGNPALACRTSNSTGTVALVIFSDGNSQDCGSIDVNATANTTNYSTSSDQRLKENIVDAPAGNIDAIRVRSFDWKSSGHHQTYGLVAQELVDVAPEAVSQGKKEEDTWKVDYSKLVPMMIKEIQDLKAEVAALKGA